MCLMSFLQGTNLPNKLEWSLSLFPDTGSQQVELILQQQYIHYDILMCYLADDMIQNFTVFMFIGTEQLRKNT